MHFRIFFCAPLSMSPEGGLTTFATVGELVEYDALNLRNRRNLRSQNVATGSWSRVGLLASSTPA